MLSRRSVRVKVMQLLYMLNRDESITFPDLLKQYNQDIWQAFELYVYQLHLLVKVAGYAERDAENRAKKLLPSEEDKAFTPRLFRNDCMRSISEHVDFLRLVEKYDANKGIDEDQLRVMYQSFVETPEYKTYFQLAEPSNKDHSNILLELYKFLGKNDVFIELSEDRYASWEDNESLVVGGIKRTLKALPVEGAFYAEFEPSDQTVREFGENLLRRVCQEDPHLMGVIEPLLKGWESNRLAVLDLIMIKMGLCEFLYFPTIPVKVTLNEFVEISKLYSNDKSKDFINGILDSMLKKLQAEGKIQKEGRGLME